MAVRLPTRLELSAVWPRVGSNALPRPVRVLFRCFVIALVGEYLRLEQSGLALVMVLLSLIPTVPEPPMRPLESLDSIQSESAHGVQQARGLAEIELSEVVSWWQCGLLVVLKTRSLKHASSTAFPFPASACYRVLWIAGSDDEAGRQLLRELRQLDTRRSVEH